MKVYGPYLRQDGRKHVILINPETGKRKTQSYPRYLMETHLGRPLLTSEEVDHIDNDFTNDSLDNLQILNKAENCQKEMSRPHRKAKWYSFVCPVCLNDASISLSQYKSNQLKKGKSGPYCSRQCAGKLH